MFSKPYKFVLFFLAAYMMASITAVNKIAGVDLLGFHVWSNYFLIAALLVGLFNLNGNGLDFHLFPFVALTLLILFATLLGVYAEEARNHSSALMFGSTYPFLYYFIVRFFVKTESEVLTVLRLLMFCLIVSILIYYHAVSSIIDLPLLATGVRLNAIVDDDEFINTNTISYLALSLFVCAVAYRMRQRSKEGFPWLIFSAFLFSSSIYILNQTRAALIITVVLLLSTSIGKDRPLSIKHVWIIVGVVVLVMLGVISYIGIDFVTSFLERYSKIGDDSRLVLMQYSFDIFIENPIFGDPKQVTHDHNFYTLTLSHFGIFGTGVYMAFAFGVLKCNISSWVGRSFAIIILILPAFAPLDTFYGSLFFCLYILSDDCHRIIRR